VAETQTPNFKWTKPDLGGDAATWGNVLNTTIDAIDAVAWANQQAGVPIGSLTMWAGPTTSPPANWLICDGRTLDYGTTPAYQGLFNIIGRAFNTALTGTQFALPNLVQNFPLGAGSTNALGTAGGATTVTLNATMIPAHTHTATQPAHGHAATQAAHTHAVTTGGHNHSISTGSHSHTLSQSVGLSYTTSGGAGAQTVTAGAGPITTSTAGDLGGSTSAAGNLGGNTDTLAPAITVPTAQPTITVANTGGGAAHPNMPPFIAINFIIRYM
jgi:microcystin-dependent protein